MSKKKVGLLFCFLGIIFISLSVISDYLRGRPQSFGPAQIAFAFLGLVIIYLGLYLRGFRIKNLIYIINNILQPSRQLVTILFLIVIIILLIYPLHYVINYLTFPYPLEYRDAASIDAAVAFSKGINPYSLQNFPEHIYLYGLMYPLTLAPIVNLVEHPIMAAKALDIVFLFLFLGMSFWIFRKRKASLVTSLIGVLILLNSTCYIYKINGTRPDVLGLFFSILGLSFLFQGKIGLTRIVLSALACVVSFYFKQYMIFSALVAAIYLFLFESKQKGALFIFAAIAIGLSSFIIIRRWFPLYYEYSILHHITIVGSDTSYMEMQTKSFLRYYWILCLLYLYYLAKSFYEFDLRRLKMIRVKLTDLKEPLINGGSMNLFNVGVIISTFILTYIMGGHQGNLYTYYGELLLPFLLYLIIPKIDGLFKEKLFSYLINVLILIFCFLPFRGNYITDFDAYKDAFIEITHFADNCASIYDETPLVALYKIEHNMYPIFNNGQIEYAWSAIPNKEGFLGRISKFQTKDFNTQISLWDNGIYSSIDDQKFNCIFSEYDQEIEGYKQVGKIENVLGRTIYVKVPINP